MITRFTLLLALLSGTLAVARAQSITLKRHAPAPGAMVGILVETESKGGTMAVTRDGKVEKGKIDVKRERFLVRKQTGKGANARLSYLVKKDQVTTDIVLGTKASGKQTESALAGKTVEGMRDRDGHWRLFLRGKSANTAQAKELAELEAYENRRWFLNGPVKVGQSCPIDPGFIRHIAQRDVDTAKVEARATLKEIAMVDNERTAVISIRIYSRGAKDDPKTESGVGVLISLEGTLYVALDSMLDKRLTLEGPMVSITNDAGHQTMIRLPTKMVVLKTVK